MTEENAQIEPSVETYGYEGGSISLVPLAMYEINGKQIVVPAHILITDAKPSGKPVSLKIMGKNAFDSILRVLKSRKGMNFRSSLADTISMDSLES